jgi:hypothetical protein
VVRKNGGFAIQGDLEMTAFGAFELNALGQQPPPKLAALHIKVSCRFGEVMMQHLCCYGNTSVAYFFGRD